MGNSAKAGDIIPLEKLNGRIISILGSDTLALCFDCPVCDSSHWHAAPFHRAPPQARTGVGKVWKRSDPEDPNSLDLIETVESITLIPSFKATCVHCYIRAGCLQIL